MKRHYIGIIFLTLFLLSISLVTITGCDGPQQPLVPPKPEIDLPREETHGKKATPNYDIVFPKDEVNRIDITFDPIAWRMLMDDMAKRYGTFGETPPWGIALNRHERAEASVAPEALAAAHFPDTQAQISMGGADDALPVPDDAAPQAPQGNPALQRLMANMFQALTPRSANTPPDDTIAPETPVTPATNNTPAPLQTIAQQAMQNMLRTLLTGNAAPAQNNAVASETAVTSETASPSAPAQDPALQAMQNMFRTLLTGNAASPGDGSNVSPDATPPARPMLEMVAWAMEAMTQGIDVLGDLAETLPEMGEFNSDPIWQPCQVTFKGLTWEHTGFRFKGLSTLTVSWWRGLLKLPFRLDFDEFEDDFPDIKNQRFFGFKKLTMASALSDNTLIREKVASDIFRESGVPAAMTAFYRVYIDYGDGPVYFGLYTMVEDPNGPMLETQFSDDDGNLYKPEGTSAQFSKMGFNAKAIRKVTNKDDEDWSDVQALFDALHAAERTENPEVWRANLENIFNVDEFLRYLAVNGLIENWDTYGRMSHNYYLYGEPKEDEEGNYIHWIPWDNNMSLTIDDWGFMPPVSLSLDEVGNGWPLIRFLIDDPVYKAQYAAIIEEIINGPFSLERCQERYQEARDLTEPYVVGENGERPGFTHLHLDLDGPEAYDIAFEKLMQHAEQRQEVARDYLAKMKAEGAIETTEETEAVETAETAASED